MPPQASSGSNGVQRVLAALASLRIMHGLNESPKKQVATMADISNATLPSMLSRMVKKGLIEYGSSSDMIRITDEGMAQADTQDIPTSNEECQERIKQKLQGKSLRIFEYLADGRVHSKQSIMEAVDCTNPKTFAPLLSRELKKKGYIHYPSRGTVQLSEMCFPFGRDTDE